MELLPLISITPNLSKCRIIAFIKYVVPLPVLGITKSGNVLDLPATKILFLSSLSTKISTSCGLTTRILISCFSNSSTSFRKQSDDNKQASEGEFEGEERIDCERNWRQAQAKSIAAYKNLIDMGMAKEQARSILPLTVYTQVWWTASFQSIMNFIELRDEKTAQVEIQEYARALKGIMLEVFPETTKLWEEVYWNED